MNVLDRISGPADLRALDSHEVDELASEIRRFLISHVSATGGHLGPNLGVVELTIAIHREFSSPRDPIIFDTGHQGYVHKILTGRAGKFGSLRTAGGLSGYPSRAESPHDVTESSHASASLGYADGLAKAFEIRGETDRTVVALVGDGALTGGMAWEALNNFAVAPHRPVVIIINDNGRSYSPTIGGLGVQFAENGAEAVASQLGLECIGPVDGHDLPALEAALRRAHEARRTVIVHAKTLKGHGYEPAESDSAEHMHSTAEIDPETGSPLSSSSSTTYTDILGDELCHLAGERPELVAVTAAMSGPTGLSEFAKRFPDRFFDVGIAEQHAVASASGLALGGMHPVVTMYSTFLGRAFDQLLMDVALIGQPVTITLDRAGITGPDGPSHHGMWDLSLAAIVPGLRVAAPRDEPTLRRALGEAVAHADGPTLVRFPKGAVAQPVPTRAVLDDGVEILSRAATETSTSFSTDVDGHTPVMTPEEAIGESSVLLFVVGAMVDVALDCQAELAAAGIDSVVINSVWILPIPARVVELAAKVRQVTVIEDGLARGGIGSATADALSAAGVETPLRHAALPQEFIAHGGRSEILADAGLTGAQIAERIARDLG